MTVTKIKLDFTKYIQEGEKEKLEYPNPPKSIKNKYVLSPDIKSDLEFPTKKMATESFEFKQEDVMNVGEKEKLIFNKPVEYPDEGNVKVTVDTKVVKKYIPEAQKGDIEKSKSFAIDENVEQEKVKVDVNKYFLNFEKTKPFQKQFSLNLKSILEDLKSKGFNRKSRRQFKNTFLNLIKEGKSEQEALEIAKNKLPKPNIMQKEATLLPDVIGYTFVSFLKWAKEDPEEFHKLLNLIDTYQYYDKEILKQATLEKYAGRSLKEWLSYLKKKGVSSKIRRQFKHIWTSALERGESEEYASRAAIDILPKSVLEKPTKYHGPEKSGPLSKSATLDEEIQRVQERIQKLQEDLVNAQKQLAELETKKAEELAKKI